MYWLKMRILKPCHARIAAAHLKGDCTTLFRGDRSTAYSGLCQRRHLTSPGREFRGSLARSVGTPTLKRVSTNRKNGSSEKLWRDLFSDPLQWWDNRVDKPNWKFPDFKHKKTGEGLWVIDKRNPQWVALEIDSIAPGSSVFSWAQKLSRSNQAGKYRETLQTFQQMQEEDLNASAYVAVHVLNACAALQLLEEGKRIHRHFVGSGCELNIYVSSALVDMYTKCGSIEDAWRVFEEMPKRDVVVWSAMILGCAKCGQGEKALELFQQMQHEGLKPNSITFVGLVTACSSIGALEEGRRLHEQITRSGFESDVYIGSSLVDMYAKCGSIDEARRVFEKMPRRNVVVWTSMIVACAKCGQGLRALELFDQMQKARVEPNVVTLVGVLNACASVAALEQGRCVHKQIIQSGCASDLYVGSGLVDMYAKCGSVADALRVFNNMPTRNVVSWNAMIMGYAMHGLAKEAVALFERMFQAGSEMNEVTFICVLSACSHGGLVKEGMQYFESMRSVYGVSPGHEHYTCIVDILGRAGHLEDAEKLIKNMPLEPTAAAWTALLGACRTHGHTEMGERAAKRVQELEPKNSSGFVLLSNLYAAAGQFDSSNQVQNERRNKGVKKRPGCTWIEVNNEVHSFLVNDTKHPQIEKIHEELTRLLGHMKEAGYVPDVKFALHDVEEEKKVAHLFQHSEKLAIAFGLISTPAGTPLRIVKNLRVCGDCHTATKFISRISGRAITVRDANRFHVVTDGHCSCGDYW